MNSLRIRDDGVLLQGPPGKNAGPLPAQAFTLSLNDSVIENMIKCYQDGQELSLALGASPTFHFGTKSHRVSKPLEPVPCDLYLTKPYESTRQAHRIPHTGSLFEKPKISPNDRAKKTQKDTKSQSKSAQPSNVSSSSLDSDIEALQDRLAAADAAKERSVVVSGLPASRKGAAKAKGKFLAGNAASPRSLPTSPALKPTSPSLNAALSSSEQAMERAKLQRRTLIHELAAGDQTLDHLEDAWDGKMDDFRSTLEKVATEDSGTKKWVMKKSYWRELDPWHYDYSSEDQRLKVIDNAIKQYDKLRVSASEPEWQRLLPMEERGKGKCLSKLQAHLAKGPAPAPPKIKVQKAEDSSNSSSKDDADISQNGKAKSGGESMTRSSSNPLPKPKKPTAQQSQAKRLLSNTKAKPSTPKVSPTKKAAPAKTNGRILSQEFIENSDSSGDDNPPPPPKPASTIKPTPKPVEKSVAKPKPVVRDPVRQPSGTKRPRDEEDSSSSSGTPLSKRLKPKQPLPVPQVKKRPVDTREARPPAREQAPAHSQKNKNTSPVKSSPLASSPPTNASELSEEEPQIVKKRKAINNEKAPPAKRKAISQDVLIKAQKFKSVYQKYEALHFEVSSLENPPDEKLDRLTALRDRLQGMKDDIYRHCDSVRR